MISEALEVVKQMTSELSYYILYYLSLNNIVRVCTAF